MYLHSPGQFTSFHVVWRNLTKPSCVVEAVVDLKALLHFSIICSDGQIYSSRRELYTLNGDSWNCLNFKQKKIYHI